MLLLDTGPEKQKKLMGTDLEAKGGEELDPVACSMYVDKVIEAVQAAACHGQL